MGKAQEEVIGFDPLAWMSDDQVEQQLPSNEVKSEPEVEVVDIVAEEKKIEETNTLIEDDVQNKIEIAEVEEIAMVNENADVEIEEPVAAIIQEEKTVSESKIILEATLNIQTVSALYDQFLKLLDTENTIEIDASAVESIDTATLQLITVLKQASINLQKEVIIDFPSDKFIESAELLGLAELLEVDQSAAGFF